MFQRTLKSLESQNYKDWNYEVHNNDPEDSFPAEQLAKAADARKWIVNHPKNLCGTATMNAFHVPLKAEIFFILEEDNWWEPIPFE